MSADTEDHAPHFYGGQAVLEGVMMRGRNTWAVAVRRPDGVIYLERHQVSDFPKRNPIWTKPMLRGMWGLVDALTIGTRALTISANAAVEDEEQLSKGEMGGSLLVALVAFIGIFIVLPNLGLAAIEDSLGGGDTVRFHLVEGLVRLVIFMAYLLAISMLADIKRVFRYHGGEHKTIMAWEHGEDLRAPDIQPYSTKHPRCGTNFLLIVMFLAIVIYTTAGIIVPSPDGENFLAFLGYQVGLRVVLLPVVAGLAYEVLRLGADQSNPFLKWLAVPGLWLQKITTKEPDDEMVEVAIRAFEAVVPSGDLDGRTTDLPSPIEWGADTAAEAVGLPKPVAAPESEADPGSAIT
ncbi:DUF1385 domain-containing protein [Euzebya tangerina]|uniref:DUF1385 domain-containing protein n=1 Tax=Euzebya tangerina TaxID=591198 RepID=UPI000E312324|nr:DUF1385 domain-containing protein [Euzebya tangerina]